MRESQIFGCRVQILRNDLETPCGWGVVVSRRRILTCTHVVETAEASRQKPTIKVRFIGLVGSPECEVRPVIRNPTYASRSAEAETSDICVLELHRGEFPANCSIVAPWHGQVPFDVDIFGYGLKEGFPDGHPIQARRLHAKMAHRIPLISEQHDLVIREGSSGTPLFISDKGMIGMCVAAQDRQTGFYIPVEVLARAVPELSGRRVSAAFSGLDGGEGLDSPKLLRLKLSDKLHLLDRVPQLTAFKARYAAAGQTSRRSFVCLIAGAADDLPHECRTRIEKEIDLALRTQRGRTGVSGGEGGAQSRDRSGDGAKLQSLKLAWPRHGKIKVEAALDALVRQLDEKLSAVEAPFDGQLLHEALASALAPMLYFSNVAASAFDESHHALLRAWVDLVGRLNSTSLPQPFVHFLTVRFDPPPAGASRTTSPGEHLEKQLDRLLAGQSRPGWAERLFLRRGPTLEPIEKHEAFKRLPALDLIDADDVDRWIGQVAAELGVPEEAPEVEIVKQHFGAAFDEQPEVHLKRIELRARIESPERQGERA